jgi:hypothetical protein
MRRGIAVFAVMVGLCAGGVDAAPASPMEECTQQWLDLKADRATYRPFLVQCLKHPPAATEPAGPKRPNRMSQCAAKWRGMKAKNATKGQSYRQFSSQCLRGN